MVLKNTSPLRDSPFVLSESLLAAQVGEALRDELGASRRATKVIMRWTGVSDTTARAWIHGRTAPSGSHLLALAANCRPVMIVLLQMTGHGDLELGFRLREVENDLSFALAQIRKITGSAARE